MEIIARVHKNNPPQGTVQVSGAKNSATRLMAAALISNGEVVLNNFPEDLIDVKRKAEYIEQVGGKVMFHNSNRVTIQSDQLSSNELSHYYCPVRTTYLFVAGLLKKTGVARIPYPEGCKIGKRGYDLHVMVWESFGATVVEFENYIEITIQEKLVPANIEFPISTIGGTENALLCAAISEGVSTIKNAYISPEVQDLINFLIQLGVSIETQGDSFIRVKGCNTHKGTEYSVIPDRIEVVTWLIYAIISRGTITIENVPFHSLEAPLLCIKKAGIDFRRDETTIYFQPGCIHNNVIQPFEIATGKYPDIISDMQPFFTLLGLFANGKSSIIDYRYPDRIDYCVELEKLFPNQLKWKKGHIITEGKLRTEYSTKENHLYSTDLRGAMAILIGALVTPEKTIIHDAQLILRGYNQLEKKLKGLGVQVDFSKVD